MTWIQVLCDRDFINTKHIKRMHVKHAMITADDKDLWVVESIDITDSTLNIFGPDDEERCQQFLIKLINYLNDAESQTSEE